ncbi:MAG: response regulator [Desulfovibrionaceae bacterium]
MTIQRNDANMHVEMKAQPAESVRVLVADDDRTARIGIAAYLARLGHACVAQAATAEEALALAAALRPDLVLMDVQFTPADACAAAAMQGIEAASVILDRYDVPVVFLSAHADDATLERATQARPVGYVPKPCSERELGSAIRLGLYQHRLERDLRRAKLAAEEADGLKAAFLATLSHEIRTPMNGILGMIELLGMAGLTGSHRENLGLLRDSAVQLMVVLNQILDFAKMEAGSLEPMAEEFDLGEVVRGLVRAYAPRAAAKGLALGFELHESLPPRLFGDGRRLRQALEQVVDNALKYTPAGWVRVRAAAGAQAPEGCAASPDAVWLDLRVEDSGPGIAPEQRQRVFQSFFQLEDYMTRRQGGLGLGLALCRKLVTLLGGRVWAEAAEGGGARLRLVLPFAPVASEPRGRICALSAGTGGGLRVLVADDDRVGRLYLTRLLEREGMRPTAVADGAQALTALAREDFDLVLMDIEMPVLDGLHATRAIRGGRGGVRNPEVPIVALTAHAMWGDEQRSLQAGMDEYLPKPVEMEPLMTVMETVLARRCASGTAH